MLNRMIFKNKYKRTEGEGAKRFRESVAGTFRLFNEICIGDCVCPLLS